MKRYIKAADGAVFDVNDKQTVAAEIALNIEAEWDAIEGYQKLIPFCIENHFGMIISKKLNSDRLINNLEK